MSRTAEYERNPMRQDLEEIGDLIGVHLACNAILNTKKEIVRVIAGQPRAVMQDGIPLSRSICQVEVGHRYDLVIASAGGHPKDINFYQAQKALTHAAMLTRSGGVVILAVACPEGVGSEGYARWMEGVSSQAEAMQRFQREGFQVGPHKAFLVARDATRIRVILVSDMEGATVERLLLEHSPSISDAVAKVQSFHPGDLEIAILPNAVATIPLVRE
jgi:nickel-dependent lactate racemase